MNEFDLAVIGAGPGGYVAAIRAAQLGLKVALIDDWDLDGKPAPGGTCLNAGCIPSKALLESSHFLERIQSEAVLHGIKVAAPNVDLEGMHARKDTIVDTLQQGIMSLVRSNGITFVHGRARFQTANSLSVSDAKGGESSIQATSVLIATGSSPVDLSIARKGQSIGDSTTALAFDEVPADLGIIGAGVIGLELGSVWRRLGARVTIMEASEDFLPAVDRDLSPRALEIFRRQGLQIMLGCKVVETENDDDYVAVVVEHEDETHELEFDRLIVAAGRRPNSATLGLEDVGVEADAQGFIVTDAQHRTSLANVYAIGDVTRGPMLAHKASHEGIEVADLLGGATESMAEHSAPIPWVIYTWPEIAWFGPTEQELEAAGKLGDCQVSMFPLAANGRAHTLDAPEGMVKIITNGNDEIIAMHILGPHASELIGQGTVAAFSGLPSAALRQEVKAHPSLSESLHEAVLGISGQPLHFFRGS